MPRFSPFCYSYAPCLPLPFPVPCSLVDQLTSQHAGQLGEVQCGETFALEVSAWDAFGNRCSSG
jgi:hypothetical protein